MALERPASARHIRALSLASSARIDTHTNIVVVTRQPAGKRKMDVPTHDTIGLNIYRELVGRENRSVGTWEKRYGKKVAVLP